MMQDLRKQLKGCLGGRICLMGIGNVEYGDDGFGVRLAESLLNVQTISPPTRSLKVIIAGKNPEQYIGRALDGGIDHLVFLDAVDLGVAPGSAVLMEREQIVSRFPQISTHRISLGLLALWAEDTGSTKAWLLGVQPGLLKSGRVITPEVQKTLDVLHAVLRAVLCIPMPRRSIETDATAISRQSAVMQ
jgi:hydrogenase maturation protease